MFDKDLFYKEIVWAYCLNIARLTAFM